MPLTGVFPFPVSSKTFPDTFKYVENHVHNVGGNFKRFCSDVVQDLFPISADSEKREAKAVNPVEKSIITMDNGTNLEISLVGTCSDSVLKQSSVAVELTGDVNKPVVLVSACDDNGDELQNAKSISEESESRKKDVNGTIDDSLVTGLVSNIPLCDSTSPGYESELQNAKSINEESESRKKDANGTIDDSLVTGLVSNIPLSDSISPGYESEISSPEEPDRHSFDDRSGFVSDCSTGVSPRESLAVADCHIFVDRSGFISDCSNGLLSPRESSAIPDCHNFVDRSDFFSDCSNGLLSPRESSAIPAMDGAEERKLVSSASNLSLESIESVGSSMVTINLHDEVKRRENFLFVDDTALYATSRRARKLGSYKKKIRDIFTPKKRLASEYEQLAIWYGDTDMDSSHETQDSSAPKFCDSDWELL